MKLKMASSKLSGLDVVSEDSQMIVSDDESSVRVPDVERKKRSFNCDGSRIMFAKHYDS